MADFGHGGGGKKSGGKRSWAQSQKTKDPNHQWRAEDAKFKIKKSTSSAPVTNSAHSANQVGIDQQHMKAAKRRKFRHRKSHRPRNPTPSLQSVSLNYSAQIGSQSRSVPAPANPLKSEEFISSINSRGVVDQGAAYSLRGQDVPQNPQVIGSLRVDADPSITVKEVGSSSPTAPSQTEIPFASNVFELKSWLSSEKLRRTWGRNRSRRKQKVSERPLLASEVNLVGAPRAPYNDNEYIMNIHDIDFKSDHPSAEEDEEKRTELLNKHFSKPDEANKTLEYEEFASNDFELVWGSEEQLSSLTKPELIVRYQQLSDYVEQLERDNHQCSTTTSRGTGFRTFSTPNSSYNCTNVNPSGSESPPKPVSSTPTSNDSDLEAKLLILKEEIKQLKKENLTMARAKFPLTMAATVAGVTGHGSSDEEEKND